MFCPECGTKNDLDAKFCAACGHALSIKLNTRGHKQNGNMNNVSSYAKIFFLITVIGIFIVSGYILFARAGSSKFGKKIFGHSDSGTDLEMKISELQDLMKTDSWRAIAEKYYSLYGEEKRKLKNEYSFDQDELNKRLTELDQSYEDTVRNNPTLGIIHLLLKDSAKISVLEKKSENILQACPDVLRRHNRMILKISYPNGNGPYYFSESTSFLSPGIFESKDFIVKKHYTGNYRMGDSDLPLVLSWIHEIRESTIIIDDYSNNSKNGNFIFSDLPTINLYSISAIDGLSLKGDDLRSLNIFVSLSEPWWRWSR
jgi:hypothetical protein